MRRSLPRPRNMPQPPLDPPAGRMTVALAGFLGVTAIIAYTANTSRPRAEVSAPAPTTQAYVGLAELGARAATARGMLDNDQMARSVAELERFESSTTLATKATAAKVELLELYAAVALEASIRAELDPIDRQSVQKLAATSITRARDLGRELDRHSSDPGRIDAALARAELASGTDITESFPLVLLPSFRDPELRAAAISMPLWRGPEPSEALAASILAQLKATERQTALVRLLTAVALAHSGADDAASAQINDVLADVPQQPLARMLRKRLDSADVVAIADDPPVAEPAPPTADNPDAPVVVEPEPEPTIVAEPTVTPDPPVVVEPTPKPVTPKPVTPKPVTPKPDGDSKKKAYDTLLADGCKLVRSGKADAGFDLLKQAFDLKPNAVAVTVCMAEAHHALGRDASARALCDRALRSSPSDRRALLLAAELELARGNESAAKAHYRKVLENHPDDNKAKSYLDAHGG